MILAENNATFSFEGFLIEDSVHSNWATRRRLSYRDVEVT
jgi:hypothetical protein